MNFTDNPFERMMRQRPGTDSGHPCKHCRHKWECGYLLHQCRSAGGRGAKPHEDGPRCGYQLFHSGQRGALQRCQQRQGFIQVGQFDQQRIEGDGQETHAALPLDSGHDRGHGRGHE
mgnify:CR=1 FL=1